MLYASGQSFVAVSTQRLIPVRTRAAVCLPVVSTRVSDHGRWEFIRIAASRRSLCTRTATTSRVALTYFQRTVHPHDNIAGRTENTLNHFSASSSSSRYAASSPSKSSKRCFASRSAHQKSAKSSTTHQPEVTIEFTNENDQLIPTFDEALLLHTRARAWAFSGLFFGGLGLAASLPPILFSASGALLLAFHISVDRLMLHLIAIHLRAHITSAKFRAVEFEDLQEPGSFGGQQHLIPPVKKWNVLLSSPGCERAFDCTTEAPPAVETSENKEQSNSSATADQDETTTREFKTSSGSGIRFEFRFGDQANVENPMFGRSTATGGGDPVSLGDIAKYLQLLYLPTEAELVLNKDGKDRDKAAVWEVRIQNHAKITDNRSSSKEDLLARKNLEQDLLDSVTNAYVVKETEVLTLQPLRSSEQLPPAYSVKFGSVQPGQIAYMKTVFDRLRDNARQQGLEPDAHPLQRYLTAPPIDALLIVPALYHTGGTLFLLLGSTIFLLRREPQA
ncbi:unnamed protein product [Amoebophrya sp. A120]|nr:unnamed protein product [Amoebophrya sp. A120]|eukprot:GSA120T00003302001.1